jgi:hypothetical protein
MAICLRQQSKGFGVVDRYYAAKKTEPTLKGTIDVNGTDTFTPNFLDLVKMIEAKQQSSIVLVTHGTASGFTMNLTDKTSASANTSVLDDLFTLVAPTPKTDIAYRRSILLQNAQIKDDQADELIARCQNIRSHLANALEIHIRGCNIGKDIANLVKIKSLFGCKVVTGPTCAMVIATFSPAPAPDLEAWKKLKSVSGHRREDLTAGSSKMIVDMDDLGTTATSQGAIQNLADLPAFATKVYGNSQHGVRQSMVLAAMWEGNTFYLPHESTYTGQLAST